MSDDEDVAVEIDDDVKDWVDKGKGRAVDRRAGAGKEGVAATLPHEVIVHVSCSSSGHALYALRWSL